MKQLKTILWYGRCSIFIIYFWFGILKVLKLSPAEELVKHLYSKTLFSLIEFNNFIGLFGLFECLIGICWLVPKLTRLAFVLICLHLFTTVLPIFLLPNETWVSLMTPTLIGQYIIKNLVLLATAILILKLQSENNKEFSF